jgi:hypothetical protein
MPAVLHDAIALTQAPNFEPVGLNSPDDLALKQSDGEA